MKSMSGADGDFPLKQYLGMEIDGVAPGHSIARVELGPEHLNPNGVVHGAVLFAMVDTAMGKATMSLLDDGQLCASIEVHLRFVRPAVSGSLEAETVVVKRGRSVVHLESRVHGDGGRLVATATGTFTVVIV